MNKLKIVTELKLATVKIQLLRYQDWLELAVEAGDHASAGMAHAKIAQLDRQLSELLASLRVLEAA